jgi:DNA adenine methylase
MAPVLKWPGGKWRVVKWILAHMPRHDCYVESHFGSGALFFNKEPSNVETINDLDSLVVNLFRVIRDHPALLEQAIALTPWARDEYDLCRRNVSEGDDVEKARRFLVSMWQAVGLRRASSDDENAVGSCGWRSRSTLHQSPVATWHKLPDRIHQASARLLNAQIENRPALDVITRHNDPYALIYADPPYVRSSRGSSAQEGTRLYAHEMSDDEHVELIKVLKNHSGPVLLSGYHCALYDEHLDWAHLERDVNIQNNQQRTETLYLNPLALRLVEERFVCSPLFNAQRPLLDIQQGSFELDAPPPL